MSIIRYEQVKDVAHKNHTHNGVDSPKLDFNALANIPRIVGVKEFSITGTNGYISKETHGFENILLMQCSVGGVITGINLCTASNGDIEWYSNHNIIVNDNAKIIVVGILRQ
jgi:hypothetical protein